jgi:NAD(P)-dependent dehydrogenase (short-subunit alcohol dehydrogenase family)
MILEGKSVIVTGASRGLGLATAERIAREGAHVLLTARDPHPLRAAAAAIRQVVDCPGVRIATCDGDVCRPADVARMVEVALEASGRIDGLVCNAGVYGPMGPIEEVEWSEWLRAVEINLFGTVLSCRAVLPLMRRQASGRIVVLSGGGATQPLPRISAYAASKAAVVRFAETLAAELDGTGIQVNAVAPGALNTRLLDDVLAAGPERVGADFYARARRQHEQGGTRLDRGAELIAFLLSDASQGISGRLLSAVWDDWRSLPQVASRLAASDVYTLRRIVPTDRGWTAE